MVIRLSNYKTIPIANSKAITRTDDVVIKAASLFFVVVEVEVAEALAWPPAVNVEPFIYVGAVGAALAGQVALGAIGQDVSWQIDCCSAASPGMIAVGGEQRYPKRLLRAIPTAVTSEVATPNDAAESPT